MRVRLLRDVKEDGKVKVTLRPSRRVALGWFKGVVVDVSDATGAKLIARGDAEAVAVEQGAAEAAVEG